MPIRGIAVTYNYTNNIEESERFYHNILGMRVIKRNSRWVEFEFQGSHFAMRLSQSGVEPGNHFSFVCFEVDDIDRPATDSIGIAVLERTAIADENTDAIRCVHLVRREDQIVDVRFVARLLHAYGAMRRQLGGID